MIRILLNGLLLAVFGANVMAASSVIASTASQVAVLGGESREFAATFFDASGRPAVNETVQFVNDACGTFSNGSFVASVKTDANGRASTSFTARSQGITCWVTATAGASVRWDVITYTLGQVHFEMQLSPPLPRPGEPFTLTVTPMAGSYRLYGVDVGAKAIEGTASASIAGLRTNTELVGSVTYRVTPDARVGNYDIDVTHYGRTQRLAMKVSDTPWTDLWWGGASQSGWGVSIVQHRDMFFAVIYTYDDAGRPTWYVMPGGEWNAARTSISGALYSPRGSPFGNYDVVALRVGASVGSAALRIVDGMHLALDYTINGVSGSQSITRQDYAPVDASLPAVHTDMWWGGAAQSGWGLAMLQQYRTLFSAWFTYDASGAATWFVMPTGYWTDGSTYEGRIYRASGSSWVGRSYNASAFRTTDVGSFRLRFVGEGATLDYTIDGRAGTMPLSRQAF